MSKKIKIITAGLLIILIGGVAFWLLRPKQKDVFDQKEISLKPAPIPQTENLTYSDPAGFEFTYPNDLSIQAVETNDKIVYSSLEITGPMPGKISLRVSDSQSLTTAAWLKDFEKNNVINDVVDIYFADLSGTSFSFSAPKIRKAVAINENVLYTLENPADEGYWDRAKDTILIGFKFKPEVFTENSSDSGENTDIILLDEVIE